MAYVVGQQMTPQEQAARQAAIRQAGYTGQFGGGAADNWLQSTFGTMDTDKIQFQGGVNPISIEGFNAPQKEALTSLTQPVTAGNQTLEQALSQIGNISGYLNKGVAPMTAEAFRSGVNMYQDPYTEQVINSTVGDINRESGTLRARIMAANNGEDSSSAGVQLAENDRNTADRIARETGNLRSTAFNNAANLTKGFYDTLAGNNLQAGNIATQIPALTSGIAGTQRENAIADIKNKLFAGSTIQGQNQKVLDTVTGQYKDKNAYDLQALQALAAILSGTPVGGGTVSSAVAEPNRASMVAASLNSTGVQDLLSKIFK